MVKNLLLLRGACCSLFSEAGIVGPASCHSYSILIYSLVKPILVRSFPQQSSARSRLAHCLLYPKINTRKLIFYSNYICLKGNIMNSPFVANVPVYALVVRCMVMWSRYRFADFTRLKQLSPCIIIHMSLNVLSHIMVWTQGRPLLSALCNSGRFLTIPLMVQDCI